MYDEAQQEAALSDLAILGALPRKCLVLRLGDLKQTSGGTGPSDLARRVRLVSDQLALGIRAPRKPCLPQTIPALIQSLLQDDLPQACYSAPQMPQWQSMIVMRMLMEPRPLVENHQQMLSWQRILMKQMLMRPHPVVENHPWMLFCLLNLRACHWHLHCSRS